MLLKLNGFQLKLIALLLMFTEHASRYFHELLPDGVTLALTYAGRIVAPVFIFLAVEAFFKTSNRRRYITRLYTWALIMAVGNYIVYEAVYHTINTQYAGVYGDGYKHNVFLAIAVGVSVISAIERGRHQIGIKRLQSYGMATVFSFISLFTEFSYIGLGCFAIFYFFYKYKNLLDFAYIAFCGLLLLEGMSYYGHFWTHGYQWMMVAALPLFFTYDGTPGTYRLKYLFYLF